jgi:glycosyltransferase involved in cell wall biosynthesis
MDCGDEKFEVRLDEVEKFSEAREETTTKRGLVSIIFPIYGNFYTDRLLLAIASARAQKGVNIEIIVSEQRESPELKDKLDSSVKYIFKKRDHKKGGGDFNPGETRNDAVANASGEFIYTNDSDILFMNEHFLEKSREILSQNRDMVLHRPSMRKLPIENLEEFKKRVEKNGIQASIASLNFGNEFLATTDDKKRDVRVSIANSEGDLRVRTTSMEEFKRYTEDASLKANDHVIWSESMHYGGNLMRKEQFENIGGFCEEYVNWGCEDTDLQWKLKNMFNLQFFPKIEEFTVIHLDHEKRYVVAETVDRNEGVFTRRRQRGAYQAIKEDKEQRRLGMTLSEK